MRVDTEARVLQTHPQINGGAYGVTSLKSVLPWILLLLWRHHRPPLLAVTFMERR